MLRWLRRELQVLRDQIALVVQEQRSLLALHIRETLDYRSIVKKGAHSLDDWLAIATRGLCDDARIRIREEMEEHFADAVATLTPEAGTDSKASMIALRELGSPRLARELYRKQNLTELEADAIKAFRDAMDPKFYFFGEYRRLETWQIAILLLPFLSLTLFSAVGSQSSWAHTASYICLCGFMVFLFGAGRIARAITSRDSASRGYLAFRILLGIATTFWMAAFGISAFAYYIAEVGATLTSGPVDAILFVTAAIALIPQVTLEFRIWTKIRPVLAKQ